MRRGRGIGLGLMLFVLTGLGWCGAAKAAGEAATEGFKAPENGVITEQQFEKYAAATREWIATSQAVAKAVEGSKTGAGQLAVLARVDQKLKDALAGQGLSEDEYTWIAGQVWEAYSVVMLEDVYGRQAAEDLAKQQKKNADDLDRARAKLAELQAAQKSGKRVLTKAQRDAKVQESTDAATAAAEEVKQHADEAKAAAAEAAEKEQAAAAADRLAQSPPADVSADDRQAYIEERQSEAQAARDAARDARDRVAEANKALAEAQARVDAARQLAANPDVPQTDEERAELKQQVQDAIQSTSQDIQAAEQAIAFLNEAEQERQKQLAEIRGKAPAANLEVLRRHRAQFEALLKADQPGSPPKK